MVSQPTPGRNTILVPGESLLYTALNLLCNLDSLLFWKAVSKTEHLCNVFQLYIVTCTLRYRYNLCSGRQGDKFWFLLCFPIRSAQLPGFPRVGHFWDTLYNCWSIEIRCLCALILIELCAYIWRKCMNDLLGTSRYPEFQSVEIFETPCTIIKSDTVLRFLMF